MKELLEKRARYLEEKAREMGLDFFPINYEVVSEDVMLEVISYGLPTRARHWSYGQSYDFSKADGEMGLSKVYEVILNNDPAYAFLLDTNSDVVNTLVLAHVIGHSGYFKNNFLFKKTDRKMVYHAAERAQRIDDYISKYGLDKVEHTMDMALAFEKNIDWHKGVHRTPYPSPRKVFKENKVTEFDDMLGRNAPSFKEITINKSFPPAPEYDLLWFFATYGKLESWQRDVFNIIREESFYFYPQYLTKITNEGFASFMHAELMYLSDEEHLHSHEHLEFCKTHEKVVQPGRNNLNINPYFLGFTIFTDIRKRWDEKFKNGESTITGFQKVMEVVSEEDDISFLHAYLTQEIVDDLQLFCYKTFNKNSDKMIEVVSTKAEDVAEDMASKMYHYRAPLIHIEKATNDGIELVHESIEMGTLDPQHTEKWMSYIQEIWGGMVNIQTIDDDQEIFHYTLDEAGFSHGDLVINKNNP